MRRALLGFLVGQIFFASFAMADSDSVILPSFEESAVCEDAWSVLREVSPMDEALLLGPPNGCSSICSASHGRPCSPAGANKSCFDVNQPEGCEVCNCTQSLVWSCG